MKTSLRLLIVVLYLLLFSGCELTDTMQRLNQPADLAVEKTITPTNTIQPTLSFTAPPEPSPTPTIITLEPTPTNTIEHSISGQCIGYDTNIESEVLALVNFERETAGLPELQLSPSLAEIARSHSQEMAEQGYFGHGNFSERILALGTFSAAGENIYAGMDSFNNAQAAVTSWMNSPTHLKHILSDVYVFAGVGYWCDPESVYEGYFTMDFGD